MRKKHKDKTNTKGKKNKCTVSRERRSIRKSRRVSTWRRVRNSLYKKTIKYQKKNRKKNKADETKLETKGKKQKEKKELQQQSNESSLQHWPTGPPLCTADPGDHTHTSTDERNPLKWRTTFKHLNTDSLTSTGCNFNISRLIYHRVPDQSSPARPRRPEGRPSSLEASNSTSSSPFFLTERGTQEGGERRMKNEREGNINPWT